MNARSGSRSIVVVVTIAMAFLAPIPATASSHPFIRVDPVFDGVWGHEWSASASVDVTITESDGTTVKGSDIVPTDADGNFGTGFDPAVVDIVPGDWVFVADGVDSAFHQVTGLAVGSIDPATNVVAGTATDGSEVWVDVHGSDAGRWVTADGSGVWSTDFDDVGEDGVSTFDIEPGTNGYANQCDAEGDCTWIDWRVANPSFSVFIADQEVHGYDWDLGVPVTLNIDDPANGVGVDYTDTRTPEPAPWDPSQTFVWFDPFGADGFEMFPGFDVQLTDGVTTKDHTITELAVTEVDPDADTVTGTAVAGSDVFVNIHDEFGAWRHEVATADPWTADFSVAGDELPEEDALFDIVPGTNGDANQCDDDNDCTQVWWRVRNPYIQVSLTRNWVEGWDFAPYQTVQIDIYDDLGGLLFSEERDLDENGNFGLDGGEHGEDLLPDYRVVVSDGLDSKELVIEDITFDTFDPATDDIGGTAPPGRVVGFNVGNDSDGIGDEVMSNGSGWAVNLMSEYGFNLLDDMGGMAWLTDDDGDQTAAQPLRPYIQGSITSDWLRGEDFTPSDAVAVEIFEFDGGSQLFSEIRATDATGEWWLDWHEHGLDLAAGMYIVVTGPAATKSLELVDVTFDVFDPDTDALAGTAPAGTIVNVHGGNEFEGWNAFVEADPDGNWSVDVVGDHGVDLDYSMHSQADVADDDRDITTAEPLIPQLEASLTGDWISGQGFGPSVVVEIFDGPGGLGLFESDPIPTGHGGSFDLQWFDHEIDLIPGLHVVATGSQKDLELAELTFHTLDPTTNIAAGTAPSEAWVYVNGGDESGGFDFEIQADPAGNWSFDVLAETGYDVTPDTNAEARVGDHDGDSTHAEFLSPAPEMDPELWPRVSHDMMWGGYFEPGAIATINIYDMPGPGKTLLHSLTRPISPQGVFRANWAELAFDLVPGQMIEASDGTGGSVVLEVADVTFDDFDPGTDTIGGTISGVVAPEFGVWGYNNVDFFNGEFPLPPSGAWSVDLMAEFGFDLTPGTYTAVAAPVADGVANSRGATVAHPAPFVVAGMDGVIDEGGIFATSGMFYDPAGGLSMMYEATVDYDDGGGAQPLTLDSMTFDLSHSYADDGNYEALVCVTANEAVTGCDEVVVTVNNVAPTVAAGADATIDEGGTFAQSGSFTDPGADTWTATVDYGDGGGAGPLALSGKTFALSHTYADGSDHTVEVCVTDDDGGTGCDEVVVTVNNVAPTVEAGPDESLEAGKTLSGTGSFTDPGADTWTATVDYGDGGGAGPLALSGKTFALSHTYATAGGYTLTVCVTDDDGGTGCDTRAVSVTEVAGEELEAATVGLVDPTQGKWYLRNSAGVVTSFFYGNPQDIPFMGDWDCDGDATPGLFRQSDAFAYLRNSNTVGIADIRFFFGNPDDVPLAGDFNGDGCDTLSIYRPSEQRFYIMNELGENEGGLGAAEYSFTFGNPGDKPVVGDWDGDGIDEVGLHRESTGFFYYRNTLDTGIASNQFFFGDPGDRFVAGDWGIVDGADTPAVYRPANTTFYFRHTNTPGAADSEFVWGDTAWLPVAGDFGL